MNLVALLSENQLIKFQIQNSLKMKRCAKHVAFVFSIGRVTPTRSFLIGRINAGRATQLPRQMCLHETLSGSDSGLPNHISLLTGTEHAGKGNYTWLTSKELQMASDELHLPFSKQAALYTDVAYYEQHCDSMEPSEKFRPTHYRINSLLECASALSFYGGESPMRVPTHVQEATDRTFQWCSDFVETLNLCPWAKVSLQTNNAIRLKILHQSMGLDAMENVMRESALELIDITDSGNVDANAGITFILVLEGGYGYSKEFEFQSFYDFCVDLEDRLFDEGEMLDEAEDSTNIAVGEEVTMAPFHPDWHFSSPNNKSEPNPLNYEKRAPYPTISLVRTSVIEQAGSSATSRIGLHNEKILNEYGVLRLKKLYEERVLNIRNTNS